MNLTPLERTDKAKRKLSAALTIYRETILQDAQSPERQILFWIDHSKESLTDEFRCFAIQEGPEVIGYLQYSYFREEHIFFFEYLCIKDPRLKGLVPSAALKCIEDYLAQNYSPNFSIVFEVAHHKNDGFGWQPDKKLLSYFKKLGFRKLEFDYRYPILQTYQGKVSYPADLMLWSPKGKLTLDASELRTILRCLYFKHYLRWDRPFLTVAEFRERERLIDDLYSSQVSMFRDDDTFGTSGYSQGAKKERFSNRHPRINNLLEKIFGPKLPRIITVILMMLLAQWFLGSSLLLIPFVLAVAAIYCLAEDTEASRKLLVVILARFKIAKPRSS
jgi:hypothetical protein